MSMPGEHELKVARDGGSAFPHESSNGMTLLDYFAGQALAGMDFSAYETAGKAATEAYMIANRMVEESKRRWALPLEEPNP